MTDHLNAELNVIDFCRRWRNNNWSDATFAEFCRDVETIGGDRRHIQACRTLAYEYKGRADDAGRLARLVLENG